MLAQDALKNRRGFAVLRIRSYVLGEKATRPRRPLTFGDALLPAPCTLNVGPVGAFSPHPGRARRSQPVFLHPALTIWTDSPLLRGTCCGREYQIRREEYLDRAQHRPPLHRHPSELFVVDGGVGLRSRNVKKKSSGMQTGFYELLCRSANEEIGTSRWRC